MITLTWLDSEIEQSLQGEACAKSVYDLSALITVRAYLLSRSEAEKEQPEQKPQTVSLVDYCADLDKCPTLDQVEAAIGAVAINTPEEAKRAKEARIWADILRR